MTTRMPDRSATARVVELVVADEPSAWAAAGFTVTDDTVHLGVTAIRLTGRHDGGGRGVTAWTLAGTAVPGLDHLDGLPTTFAGLDGTIPDPTDDPDHPNGATGIDHIVVLTPDLERTIAAFAGVQLPCRRIRDVGAADAPRQQAFFRCGPVVVEVVGPPGDLGVDVHDQPAAWFGLAVDVDDLDRTASLLGDRLGTIKPAVQRGRRIATFRHRDLGLSTAVAAMDHRSDGPTGT